MSHVDITDIKSTHASVSEFAKNTINPLLGKANSEIDFKNWWQVAGRFGLLGMHLPKAQGGRNSSVSIAVAAMESFGEHCTDNGVAFAVNVTLFSHASTLACCATEKQVIEFLRPLCKGERICAYALTEENTGSDAYSIETVATKVTGGYLLEGVKTYITLGPLADFAIVFATTNPKSKQWGMTAFLVDLGTVGIQSEATEKAGLKSTPIGKLIFKECFVPESNILGTEGSGAAVFEESQIWERSFVMASQVGAMQRQFNSVVSYSNNRHQFGQSIGRFQSVSNRIADMRLRMETARLMLHNVAQLKDSGKSIRIESAMAKMHLSESFLNNSLDALRIHGAKGYTGNAQSFTDLADSVAGLFLAGTNDIQRSIISRLSGV